MQDLSHFENELDQQKFVKLQSSLVRLIRMSIFGKLKLVLKSKKVPGDCLGMVRVAQPDWLLLVRQERKF